MEELSSRLAVKSFTDYSRVRFQAEAELERMLEEDFALAQYYDIFDNDDELKSFTNEMLSNAVQLNQAIAPRIYDLCSEVQEKLGFKEQIDFYLSANVEANAYSLNGYGFVPHIIYFTSALVQLMTDDELRYVIGHEIGHLIYKHGKLDLVQKFLFKKEEERPPAMLTINYMRLVKYAEISADRIGFIAMPDIKVITNAIFKLTCGLPEGKLNFLAEEYLKQLGRVKEIGVGDIFSSHPNPMIRMQALIDFSKSELSPYSTGITIKANELNEKLNELMQLLETKPKTEKDLKSVELLAALGIYMASCEEEGYDQKWNLLYDWISDYTTQPEKYLQFENEKHLSAEVDKICAYFAQQQDGTKFKLMELIVILTLIDGRLEPEEKKRLFDLATKLKISNDALNLIIRNSSEKYLAPNKRVMAKGVN